MSPRFAADRMIGRLAKMLRLLGYDTVYIANLDPAGLAELARREDRVILTRGGTLKRYAGGARVFKIQSEYAPEQLREVVRHFSLDTKAGLWTRCTVCNGAIIAVAKERVRSAVEPQTFKLYSEFFQCSNCGRTYWRGSHVERILKTLSWILDSGSP